MPPSMRLRSPNTFITPSTARASRVRVVVEAEPARPGEAWPTVMCNDAPLARGDGTLYAGDVPLTLEGDATTVSCEALSAQGLGARDTRALRVEGVRFAVGMTTEPGHWQATRCDDDDLLIVTGERATRLSPDGHSRWAYAAEGVVLEGLCLLDGGAVLRLINAGDPNVPNSQTASVLRLGSRGEAAVVPRPQAHWPLSLSQVNGRPHIVERTATGLQRVSLEGGEGEPVDATAGVRPLDAAPLDVARFAFTRPVFQALATRGGAVVLLAGTADMPPAVTTCALPGLTPCGPEAPRPELARWLDARSTDEGVLALGALRGSPNDGALVYLTP